MSPHHQDKGESEITKFLSTFSTVLSKTKEGSIEKGLSEAYICLCYRRGGKVSGEGGGGASSEVQGGGEGEGASG